jgi:hypothetical protein
VYMGKAAIVRLQCRPRLPDERPGTARSCRGNSDGMSARGVGEQHGKSQTVVPDVHQRNGCPWAGTPAGWDGGEARSTCEAG